MRICHPYSDRQHDPRKLDANRPNRAVLPAGAAVPALVRVANFHLVTIHVDHFRGANLTANPASGTFLPINHRWHLILLHPYDER